MVGFPGLLDKVCSTQKTEDKRMVSKHTIYEPNCYVDQCKYTDFIEIWIIYYMFHLLNNL